MTEISELVDAADDYRALAPQRRGDTAGVADVQREVNAWWPAAAR